MTAGAAMTHPTDDSLKPCPFCGGAASLHPRTCDKNTPYNPADRAFPVARCGQCGAEAVGKDWGRPETAAEKWNTRALLAEQAHPVAALAEELAAIGAADPEAWEGSEQARTEPKDRDWSEAQDWKGMDGVTAYLLIQRHADGWGCIGEMMNAWLAANAAQPLKAEQAKEAAEDAPDLTKLDELAKAYAAIYYSPHHFTMSVNGLREIIRAARAAERSA